jgi:hypothetical protein
MNDQSIRDALVTGEGAELDGKRIPPTSWFKRLAASTVKKKSYAEGDIVESAGTKYIVRRDGWRRVAPKN